MTISRSKNRPGAGVLRYIRHLLPCLLFLILSTLTVATENACAAPHAGLQLSPVPAWVKLHDFDSAPADPEATPEATGSVTFRLWEEQVNYAGGKTRHFLRVVYELQSRTAIANASILYGGFYEGRQELTFHVFRIWRDGKAIGIADRAIVEAVKSAAGLDDARTADMTVLKIYVPDLRVGDLLEFAYSITGDTPGLEGQRTEIYNSSPANPIRIHYRRFLTDPKSPLYFYLVGGDEPPRESRAGDLIEYSWEKKDLEPAKTEDHVPPWFDQVPMTFVSGARGWNEVVEWAQSRLVFTDPIDENVAATARDLVADRTDERDKVSAIAAFVQGKIRYLGPGLSRNGYVPFPPRDVLARRWGDCKDKVTLLIAMLKAVGITAYPALTETARGHVRPDVPTPLAFDHVIALVERDAGPLWIDATATPHDQTHASFELPQTDFVLPVREGQDALVPLPARRTLTPDGFDVDMTTFVDLWSGRKASFTTSYAGRWADAIRMLLERSGPRIIKLSYLEGFRNLGDYVETDGDVHIVDMFADNRIAVSQDFKARYFWVWEEDKERYTFEISPHWLETFIPSISEDDTVRKAPFALPHPLSVRERQVLHLPEGMDIELKETSIERDAYRLNCTWKRDGGDLVIVVVFTTLRDHLRPDEVEQFLEDRRQFSDWSFSAWTNRAKGDKDSIRRTFEKPDMQLEIRGLAQPPTEVEAPLFRKQKDGTSAPDPLSPHPRPRRENETGN